MIRSASISQHGTSTMKTSIPRTKYNRIIQTKSSPETIASLLNVAEEKYLPTRKHLNSKRVYPFWKVCQTCRKLYPTHTKEQALRNKTCSHACAVQATRGPRRRAPMSARKMTLIKCAVCGREVYKPNAWLKKIKVPTCSTHCNGVLRSQELVKHSHKGRAAWTAESTKSFIKKMSGAKNPAWKGGVTYFRKHGNYAPIKYVRCPKEFLAMARKDGYVMEHRLIMAQSLGRTLLRTEVVHHVNHDPTDNRIENLMLFGTNQEHKLYEGRAQR